MQRNAGSVQSDYSRTSDPSTAGSADTDKEVLSTESYSTLELAEEIRLPQLTLNCELCGIRHSIGRQFYIACNTRPRFEPELCSPCTGEATYFSVTYPASPSNCLRCARQLLDHTRDQLQGCFIAYKFHCIDKALPRLTPIAFVEQWPGENTHSRRLTRTPKPYERRTQDTNEDKQGWHRKY